MKQQVLIFLAIAVFAVSSDNWDEHKKKFSKNFVGSEDNLRKAIFMANSRDVDDHNKLYAKGIVTYGKGKNQFSDITFAELKAKFMGFQSISPTNLTLFPSSEKKAIFGAAPPASRDWRQDGRVGAIKNQGQCGSCWAFSAISTVESAYYAKYRSSVVLSEQNLIDCTRTSPYYNLGCGGGNPYYAFYYIYKNNGVDKSSCYPYKAVNQNCAFQPNCIGASITSTIYYDSSYGSRSGNEDWLLNAVGNYGPVSVAIYASQNFQFYRQGIFNDPLCSQASSPNHAVVVIGYGTSNGQKYWLVRNSWGTSWGEQGYIRMTRGSNQCFISSFSLLPTIK